MTQGKKRKRKLSKRRRAVYRRRRIVVGIALVLAVALTVFCVYSLGRGMAAIDTTIRHDDLMAVSRKPVPAPKQKSKVKDCTASNVKLSLQSDSQSAPVGGSMKFTATIAFVPKDSSSCLIDASDHSRVLTITSGGDTVWRSDACDVDSRKLLLAAGDTDTQTMTWNTNRSGQTCTEDSKLPKVDAGTYTAQLSMRDHPKIVSNKVTITVQ
ncbi:hypothetical protein [Bifidobacterium boum]|uniref:hypothetical protein n=1 Tax=Bifidobacterium boum TaxID=78343 RepID=UPI0005018365|nr:hypothetical protein [Bifidobacterium boum]KFJ06898.1 hypothetical protein BTHE_0894 [Bifidobacterium thermophilum]MDD6087121.1 hypothetical protein [Bifidobacterium boum]